MKKQCVLVSAVAANTNQIAIMLITKYWVFSVPFMMVLGYPAWSLGPFGATVLAIGKEKVAADPDIKVQLKRFNSHINVITILLVVYPVYNAVFRTLRGSAQFAFLFLLPVIKFVMKKATISVVSEVKDLVFVIVLAVGIFNVLFQAKCMQSSGSHWTMLGIIAMPFGIFPRCEDSSISLATFRLRSEMALALKVSSSTASTSCRSPTRLIWLSSDCNCGPMSK